MPSILSGYEYDIFISYRHNDNRSGWVSDFAKSLQQELAATIKDKVSLYLDSNPEDGILETDSVDKSLEGKLKCLIFIPILSQTYCDPKSFAWQHEFLAFNKLASADEFGRDIRLKNGNFTSRILPVRIHDLDPEDHALLQNELGGVLRSVDFIYKEPGVNRPLRPEDSEDKNINKTRYTNQVNKVANAIKEILTSLKQPAVPAELPTRSVKPIPVSTKRPLSEMKLLILGATVVLMLAIGYGSTFFTKETSSATSEIEIDRSIAVLPFADMSASKDQEYFSDGLSEELLNLLAKIPDLKVISRTSAFSFKGKDEDIRSIAAKLGVAYLLEGSVRKSMDKVRITTQLIRASDGSHVWSENYDREMNDIFKVQDEIASAVVKELRLKLLGNDRPKPKESRPDVYNLWLESRFYSNLGTIDGAEKSFALLQQANALDSTDARVWSELARGYRLQAGSGLSSPADLKLALRNAFHAAEKSLALDPNLSDGYSTMGGVLADDWQFEESEKYLQKAVNLDPTNSYSLSELGRMNVSLGRFDKAEALFRKSVELDPMRSNGYYFGALTMMSLEKYDEALAQIQKAIMITPRPSYFCHLSLMRLLAGHPDLALNEIEKVEDEFWKEYGTILVLWGVGRKAESDSKFKIFEKKYGDSGAFQIAEIYSWRKENDKAFAWLEQAYNNHDPGLADVKGSIFFYPVKEDARFKRLLTKLKLPVI